jgi:hypothetical protein
MTDTQEKIAAICDAIKKLLLEKNARYGDSALNPTRIFSKANTIEQLFVRIDDKLSRISRGIGLLAKDEDVIDDLIGYLVLLKIAMTNTAEGWSGEDIEPIPFDLKNKLRNTSDASKSGNNLSKLNDTEWLDMFIAGDRFG